MTSPVATHDGASPLFGPIGLAMSGGGYRASAFHLGALDYLEHLGRLPSLQVLSTVSGGTFTGARFALSLVRRQSFSTFFTIFYGELRDVDLVGRGLEKLAHAVPSVPSGRRDLIVALAEVYSETFFAHEGGPWCFAELLDGELPVDTLVFNATEFRTGLAFRFQRSRTGFVGNRLLRVKRPEARLLRIADIVAASSCFPGGLEPLAFPQDFGWPGGEIPPALRRGTFARPVALMDGGVYDNQGTESLLRADRRLGYALGQVIISDVDQRSGELYAVPPWRSGGWLGRVRLGALALLAGALAVAALVTAGGLACEVYREGLRWPVGVVTRLLPILFALLLAAPLAALLWLVLGPLRRKAVAALPQLAGRPWRDLWRLDVDQLVNLATLRLGSLVAMSASIFMKRIRAMGYARFFDDPRYRSRRVSNLVYHLDPAEPFASSLDGLVPAPSEALGAVAGTAAAMPTVLWFDRAAPHQLPCLVAAGQATLCYNLMKQVVRLHGRDPARYPAEVKAYWGRLVADWEALRADPYALLRHRDLGELQPPPTRSS